MEPPEIASFGVLVHFSAIRYSAAAMKSSNTFCLFCLVPPLCQSSPYSPPPRRLGTAYTPPISIHARFAGLNDGVSEMLNPP